MATPDRDPPHQSPRSLGPRLRRRSWAVLRAGLRAGLCAVAFAWSLSPWLGADPVRLWLFDLAASAVAWVVPLALIGAVVEVVLATRHRSFRNPRALRALPWLLAVAAAVLALAPGRSVFPKHAATGGGLEVLTVNALASNERHDELASWIALSGVDVAVVVEPPVPLQRALREPAAPRGAAALRRSFPHALRRQWTEHDTDPAYIFSIWPLEAWPRAPGTGETRAQRQVLGAIVDRPEDLGGRFLLLVTHPDSPKNLSRYRAGWGVVDEQAQVLGDARDLGLAVLMAGDHNAGPASGWTRALRREGMTRSKPLLEPAGTFPAWSVWPAQLAIDDVWHDGGWRVTGWSRERAAGSDHHAVRVSLEARGAD